MIPKLIIVPIGASTNVFLDGKRISAGVKDLVYSARDKNGKLNPTLKLLEIDVNEFSLTEGKDFKDFYEELDYFRNLVEGEPPREGRSDD